MTQVLSRVAESVASACARTYLLLVARRADVRYRVVRDAPTLERIGALRKNVYATARSSYLLAELDARGLDEFDARAVSFAAENLRDGELFAAVRTLRYPFEVLRFVSHEFLSDKLGTAAHNRRVIEVSRLVSSRPNRAVTNGMVLFGGIYLALHGVTRYFAYVAVPEQAAADPPADSFAIPHRRSGRYVIQAGSIAKHAARVGPRLWRSTKAGAARAFPQQAGRA